MRSMTNRSSSRSLHSGGTMFLGLGQRIRTLTMKVIYHDNRCCVLCGECLMNWYNYSHVMHLQLGPFSNHNLISTYMDVQCLVIPNPNWIFGQLMLLFQPFQVSISTLCNSFPSKHLLLDRKKYPSDDMIPSLPPHYNFFP